jgi:hypothetical protein
MGKRKRTTWRLSPENYDWLYRIMKRKGGNSMNAELNAQISEKREQAEYSAVKVLSHGTASS